MCVTQCILCHRFLPPLSHFPNSDTHFFSFHLGVRGDSGWRGGWVIAWESQREGSQSVIVLELRAWFPLPLFPLYRRVGWLPLMQGYSTRWLREVYLYLYFVFCPGAIRGHSRNKVQSVIRWNCTPIPDTEVFLTWLTPMLSDLCIICREYQ